MIIYVDGPPSSGTTTLCQGLSKTFSAPIYPTNDLLQLMAHDLDDIHKPYFDSFDMGNPIRKVMYCHIRDYNLKQELSKDKPFYHSDYTSLLEFYFMLQEADYFQSKCIKKYQESHNDCPVIVDRTFYSYATDNMSGNDIHIYLTSDLNKCIHNRIQKTGENYNESKRAVGVEKSSARYGANHWLQPRENSIIIDATNRDAKEVLEIALQAIDNRINIKAQNNVVFETHTTSAEKTEEEITTDHPVKLEWLFGKPIQEDEIYNPENDSVFQILGNKPEENTCKATISDFEQLLKAFIKHLEEITNANNVEQIIQHEKRIIQEVKDLSKKMMQKKLQDDDWHNALVAVEAEISGEFNPAATEMIAPRSAYNQSSVFPKKVV